MNYIVFSYFDFDENDESFYMLLPSAIQNSSGLHFTGYGVNFLMLLTLNKIVMMFLV